MLVSEQRQIPLFPLNMVLFPGMTLSLHIFEERYRLMIGRCIQDAQPFGVVMLRSGEEVGDGAMLYEVGTTAHITQVERLPDGRMNIATLGYHRFKIQEVRHDEPYLVGVIEDFPIQGADDPLARRLAGDLAPLLQKYLEIFARLGKVDLQMETLPHDPTTLAFLTAIILQMPMKDKQELLSIPNLLAMLRLERKMLHREAQILRLLIDNGIRWRDDPKPFSVN